MNPDAASSDTFWATADAYCLAGDVSHDFIRARTGKARLIYIPCVFLYFRSIELALKAILIAYGVTEKEIAKRALGHRISALMVRAEAFVPLSDIGIRSRDRTLLDRFSDDYSNKWFEYPVRLSRNPPPLDQLRALARRVSDVVRTHPRR